MPYDEILAIATPITLACLMNGVIYSTGMNNSKARNMWLPPGYVIACVWIVIFGLLGYVYYHLEADSLGRYAIVATIAFCLSYPLITGLKVSRIETIMNGLTLAIALAATGVVVYEKKELSYYMIPFVAWAMYVNVVTSLF